ncbi:MAG: YafY family transcriptional regulator [Burkholderiales bacterium]|nr:YafY family transcriptional regulator [Burkholderiales bacterium]
MDNPTTRLLSLLELLQSHGLTSGAELARKLAITPRTLRRYIAHLEALGIPVAAERGRDGGYRLMQGYKLPPMMFSNDEAMALALGLVASRHLGLTASAPAGASALSKLERVMPEALRQNVRAVHATVALDMAATHVRSNADVLATISHGAQKQQSLRLSYRSQTGTETGRNIDPYGLAYLEGKWYVVAFCHLRQAQRAFRLDRIQSATLLPASFGKPADFDALTYMTDAIASLPRTFSARILLHADLAQASRAIHPTLGILQAIPDGVLLHCQADDLDWMARELARLPFRFSIQAPQALADALQKHAQLLLAQLHTTHN